MFWLDVSLVKKSGHLIYGLFSFLPGSSLTNFTSTCPDKLGLNKSAGQCSSSLFIQSAGVHPSYHSDTSQTKQFTIHSIRVLKS